MRLTVDEYLLALTSRVGYTEDPPGSNRNMFAPWAGHANGQPWCASFLVGVARHEGDASLIPDTAYTPSMANEFKARGQWHAKSEGLPQRGDIVFFDFPDNVHRIQHVEACIGGDGRRPHTVGGNTSPGDAGSQSNGGGVFLRWRDPASIVGWGRPAYAAPHTTPKEDDVGAAPLPIAKAGVGALFVPGDGVAVALHDLKELVPFYDAGLLARSGLDSTGKVITHREFPADLFDRMWPEVRP